MTKHYLPPGLPSPVAEADGLDAPYWTALTEHRLLIQCCNQCRARQWGPEWICHRCLSFDVGWAEVPAEGTIYSWERAWHPVTPAFQSAVPYLVVAVTLGVDDTVRVVGNLIGPADQEVAIGAAVSGVYEDHDGFTLLQWTLNP